MEQYEFIKMGDRRFSFLLESIEDLSNSLSAFGSKLTIRIGDPQLVLEDTLKDTSADVVFCSDEIAFDEREMLDSIEAKLPLKRIGFGTLYQPEQLPFELNQLPDVFTPFRKKVERYAEEPTEADSINNLPKLPSTLPKNQFEELFSNKPRISTHPHTAFPFQGGEKAGLDRLKQYLWESDCVARYKKTRNGLLGTDYSTKFSPWLANGSLSPRRIYNEVRRYEKEVVSNSSTYWVIFELLWRDYFQMVSLKFGRKIFLQSGLKTDSSKKWSFNASILTDWIEGKTAEDFVNASMKELLLTGWMSNRGRQNVASYLAHDLGQDWRYGAAWFESQLIDYDPASNWGNWAYVAGVGNDPRPQRKFNIRSQQERYDANQSFTKLWKDE
jgi:deoxyribodipyrimidine photo-lyase